MNKKPNRYTSPSTPSVAHDLSNFIVEAVLINRHGMLPEAGWRKGSPLYGEWGRLLKCIRRISNTLDVKLQQLAWFVQFYKIKDIKYEDFGLLRWRVKKYFKWCNIQKFVEYYSTFYSQLSEKSSSYVEASTGYKTKVESNTNRQKTLSEILLELENVGTNE